MDTNGDCDFVPKGLNEMHVCTYMTERGTHYGATTRDGRLTTDNGTKI